MTDNARADLTTIRAFFAEGGKPVLTLPELKALKKDPDTGEAREDYSQIAEGIGNGTYDYPLTSDMIKRARAACAANPRIPSLT